MTHPIIKTDNYILITSDEEIKVGDFCLADIIASDFYGIVKYNGAFAKHYFKKIIAHLPLNNSPILEGVPLLPPLPNEEDEIIENLENYLLKVNQLYKDWLGIGFKGGYHKAKEKYKFTEDDMIKAFEYGKTLKGYDWIGDLIESLSQPKLPVGFKCETKSLKQLPFNVEMSVDEINKPKIFKGVMQGEWIFE